jgi:virginiamycin B lyase
MNRFTPFSEDALEQSIREYYQQREAPIAPFEQSWAALKTALDAQPVAGQASSRFNVAVRMAGDDDEVEFILEDALEDPQEDTLEDPMPGDEHTRPTTTVPSPRMDTRRRGLSPRATAIAAVAAVLILVIIAATIFTQLAVRRTQHPAATATPSAGFTKVITLPNPTAELFGSTTASDGSVWFTETTPQGIKIAHVTPQGALTEFPVPGQDRVTGVQAYGITFGSDGNLWFVERGFRSDSPTGKDTYDVVRMTPAGAATRFALPTNASTTRMFAGPDGTLWYSTIESASQNMIERMTLDGHFTEYPILGGPNARITGLCAGPDRTIWYVWSTAGIDPANRQGGIVRVAATGAMQELPTPSRPTAWILCGSDGTLWYSESKPGFIGRITPSGAASDVPMPIDPNSLFLVASDGALWFATYDQQSSNTRFGRIAANGDLQIIPTPGIRQASVLIEAPGALWLVDERNNVWRYRLAA